MARAVHGVPRSRVGLVWMAAALREIWTVKRLRDFQGLTVRLTDERRTHILEHPEMTSMEAAIEETLRQPEHVVQSFSDSRAKLYYRFYFRTMVGGKYLCVVVKTLGADAFVLTAYLTDRIKKGERLWPRNESE